MSRKAQTQPRQLSSNAGLYVLPVDPYHEIADINQYDLGFDIIPKFLGPMRGYPFNGYHRNIGTLESLEPANADGSKILDMAVFKTGGGTSVPLSK